MVRFITMLIPNCVTLHFIPIFLDDVLCLRNIIYINVRALSFFGFNIIYFQISLKGRGGLENIRSQSTG